uniref:Cir_N domain-containing protein n=1 Tax=Caenorhabditis tropicalis TaxID=1561998 RepID=A0A1I7UD56_9PELO
MNILHHKSWHVRTKSNMERVRRDERKAAEEEQRVLDRQIQAENERRINTLRARADDRMSNMFGGGGGSSSKDVSISDETGHVNLFQDLEREERKNHGTGNADYEKEKAEEKKEWESKMGIQVYFADNTNDLNKKKEWYEEMPLRRMELPPRSKAKTDALPRMDRKKRDEEEEKEEKRKHKKDKKKKKKKKHRHRDRSEERRLEEEFDRERKLKTAKMRDERLKRERAEKSRTYALLHPEEIEKQKKEKEMEEKRGKKTYNSQFNPEFFRK